MAFEKNKASETEIWGSGVNVRVRRLTQNHATSTRGPVPQKLFKLNALRGLIL